MKRLLAILLGATAGFGCGSSTSDELFNEAPGGSGGTNAGEGGNDTGGTNAGEGGNDTGGTNAGGAGGNATGGTNAGGDGGGPGPGDPVIYPDGIEECMPRCLWDLIANCRPESCSMQVHNRVVVMCEESSGWYYTYDPDDGMGRMDASKNGAACYHVEKHQNGEIYYAPDGTLAAEVFRGLDEVRAVCAGDPRTESHLVDTESPECQKFQSPECLMGTCPAPW